MNGRIQVAEYGDLARRTDISRREIDGAVHALNTTDDSVLVLEEWLCGKKDLRALENERRLFVVTVLDETEKAWRVRTGERDDWIPKSQSVLLERAPDVDEIQTPTKTLSEFGSGSS